MEERKEKTGKLSNGTILGLSLIHIFHDRFIKSFYKSYDDCYNYDDSQQHGDYQLIPRPYGGCHDGIRRLSGGKKPAVVEPGARGQMLFPVISCVCERRIDRVSLDLIDKNGNGFGLSVDIIAGCLLYTSCSLEGRHR